MGPDTTERLVPRRQGAEQAPALEAGDGTASELAMATARICEVLDAFSAGEKQRVMSAVKILTGVGA